MKIFFCCPIELIIARIPSFFFFRKIMRNIPMHPESSVMYIRYFLIYRLWRKINGDVAVRNQIMAAAIASLGPLPSTFSSCILEDVLPKVPKSQPNSTKALLQHKFDVKKHCELFVQYCKESDGNSVCQKKDGPATPIDSSSRINSQMVFTYLLLFIYLSIALRNPILLCRFRYDEKNHSQVGLFIRSH